MPRADIEVDVDMESVNEGCYLWGTLLNVHGDAETESSTFISFASWNPDIDVGELEAFLAFWEWFTELRREAARRGVTFRAYCYHQAAKNGQLRRLAALCGLEEDVDDFIRSEQLGRPAPGREGSAHHGPAELRPQDGRPPHGILLGATRTWAASWPWSVTSRRRRTPTPLCAPRRRSGSSGYNEDDVHATAVRREWLDRCASLLPSIEDAAPPRPPPDG